MTRWINQFSWCWNCVIKSIYNNLITLHLSTEMEQICNSHKIVHKNAIVSLNYSLFLVLKPPFGRPHCLRNNSSASNSVCKILYIIIIFLMKLLTEHSVEVKPYFDIGWLKCCLYLGFKFPRYLYFLNKHSILVINNLPLL